MKPNERHVVSDIVWLLIGVALGFLMFGTAEADDDDRYVGLHITVPFTFNAVGAQVIVRRDNTEARAGVDTNWNYQIGAGITAFEDVVPSAGMAYSSHHSDLVPYAGIRADYDNDWEAGAVTYAATRETSYLFAGARLNDDGDDNGNNSNTNTSGGDDNGNGDGDNGGSNGGGGNGGGDSGGGGNGGGNGTPPDGGGGGGDDTSGEGNSRSGLADGTNPGRGSGRGNSPNMGTNNPGGGQ